MADHRAPITRRAALGGMVFAGALAAAKQPVYAQKWGRVYILNTAPEKVGLNLNRRALPAIIGTEREAYYIPDAIYVDRTSLIRDLVVESSPMRTSCRSALPATKRPTRSI